MTAFRRIKEIIHGIISLGCAAEMLAYPSDGYTLVIYLLGISLTLYGLGTLIYYFQMARFMVGGRTMLYIGIIAFDFGVFTNTLTDVPHYYILLYLILIHAFSGLVEILRVMEARRYGAKSWRLKLAHGIINLVMAFSCIVFIKQLKAAVFIYSLGLIYSAVMRIISACRRTSMPKWNVQ